MTAITALPCLITAPGSPGAIPGVTALPADLAGDFAALLVPPRPNPAGRQGDAGGGKDLPAASPDDDIDDPLAWFVGVPVLPTIAPAGAVPVAEAVPAAAPAAPSGEQTPIAVPIAATANPREAVTVSATPPSAGAAAAVPLPSGDVAATPLTPGADADAVTLPLPLPEAAVRPALQPRPGREPSRAAGVGAVAPPGVERPIVIDDRAAPVIVARDDTPAVAAPIASGPRVAPAAQMFAGAIRRALRDDAATIATVPLTTVPATTDIAAHAVVALHDAHAPALDVRRGDWPERMIERIEILRDAANAVDSRMRLMPDALGTIDVSLKREGDAVQVQFTAAQPETRQLLIDAQPRLDALAEARGIRLSHGGSAASGDAAGQHRQAQQQASQPSAPASARAADDDDSTDSRVA